MFDTLVTFRDELRRSAAPALDSHKRIVDDLRSAHGDFNRAFARFDHGIMQVDEMRTRGASEAEIHEHVERIQQELRLAVEAFYKKVAAPNE